MWTAQASGAGVWTEADAVYQNGFAQRSSVRMKIMCSVLDTLNLR